MKICHVVYECIPDSYRGGVQKMVYELGLAQARAGAQVEIWTVGEEPDREPAPGLRLRYFAGNVRWFSSPPIKTGLRAAAGSFDVVHAHNTFLPLNRYAAAVAGRGPRVFFNPHGALDPLLLLPHSVKGLKKYLYARLVEKRNYRAATALIGLTVREAEQIRMLMGQSPPAVVVPNAIAPASAVDSGLVQRFREQWNLPALAPVLLYIGRITPKKNLERIIDSLAVVVREIPEAVLVIAGRPEEEPLYAAALVRRATERGVDGNIRWTGHLDESGKAAACSAGHLFIHTSHSEGMALAILEAMAFGLPVVATTGCYMDEAAAARALCQVPDETTLVAQAILRLLRSPAEARTLGDRAVRYVRTHHDWDRIAQAYLTLYRTGACSTGTPVRDHDHHVAEHL